MFASGAYYVGGVVAVLLAVAIVVLITVDLRNKRTASAQGQAGSRTQDTDNKTREQGRGLFFLGCLLLVFAAASVFLEPARLKTPFWWILLAIWLFAVVRGWMTWHRRVSTPPGIERPMESGDSTLGTGE